MSAAVFARVPATMVAALGVASSTHFASRPLRAQTPVAAAPGPVTAASSAPATPTSGPTVPTAPVASAPIVPPAASVVAAGVPSPLQALNLAERVRRLRERLFYAKARLAQVQEVPLKGPVVGAQAVVVHVHEMGRSFRLVRLWYALDGATIFDRVLSGADQLNEDNEIEVFSGPVNPGNHVLSVYAEYQGDGFGVFRYLQDYRFEAKSSQEFVVEEGMTATVRAIGYEMGGFTAEMRDRPAIRYAIDMARTPPPRPTNPEATPAETGGAAGAPTPVGQGTP